MGHARQRSSSPAGTIGTQLRDEAERYCALIEHPGRYEREQFIVQAWTSLAGVLASAVRLPGGVPSEASGAGRPSGAQWRERLSELEAVLGDCGSYRSTGAAYGDGAVEVDVRNLADDLADIWQDLKVGLVALEDGSATLSGACWLWGSSFTSHWGRHAVEAVRALHDLMDTWRPDPPEVEREKPEQRAKIELIPDGDHWRVPFSGTVEQVGIDYGVTLSVSEYLSAQGEPAGFDVGWTLRIDQPFLLRRPGRGDCMLTPGEDYPALGPVLAVTNQDVTTLSVWNDGRLRIDFAGGEVIEVEADEHYEAWQLRVGESGDWLIAPISPDVLFRAANMEAP